MSEDDSSVDVLVTLSVTLNRPLEVFLVTVDETATGMCQVVRVYVHLGNVPMYVHVCALTWKCFLILVLYSHYCCFIV